MQVAVLWSLIGDHRPAVLVVGYQRQVVGVEVSKAFLVELNSRRR